MLCASSKGPRSVAEPQERPRRSKKLRSIEKICSTKAHALSLVSRRVSRSRMRTACHGSGTVQEAGDPSTISLTTRSPDVFRLTWSPIPPAGSTMQTGRTPFGVRPASSSHRVLRFQFDQNLIFGRGPQQRARLNLSSCTRQNSNHVGTSPGPDWAKHCHH